MPLDVRIAQIQFIRQAGVQDEQVMGQSGPLELGARHVAEPGRLKPGPPEPLTRGRRCDERVTTLEGPEQTPRLRQFRLRHKRVHPGTVASNAPFFPRNSEEKRRPAAAPRVLQI